MQNHKRNKFVPLTVEAEDNHTVYALAKIKAIENELDAITACYDRMREALEKISNDGIERSRDPRTLIAKAVLAATPKQSLAAIKSKTLREVAGKQVYAEPHPVNDYVSRWLLTEADRVEREEV